jgi:hypothetical protein
MVSFHSFLMLFICLPKGNNRCLIHPHSMCSCGVSTTCLTKAPAQLVRAILLATAGIGEKRHGEWSSGLLKGFRGPSLSDLSENCGDEGKQIECCGDIPNQANQPLQRVPGTARDISNRQPLEMVQLSINPCSPLDRKQIHVLRSSIQPG